MAKATEDHIPLELPRNEAGAFFQFVKRVDYATLGRFTAPRVTYGGRSEHDTAWAALAMLRRQLAEAGFNAH
jgi:hypothetical protein